MKLFVPILCLAAVLLPAQWKEPSDAERNDLRRALSEVGSSPIEFVRALEKHLEKYPTSPQRPQIERALVKAAIDAHDDDRIVLYGERVLEREPEDPLILEKVTLVLLKSDSRENAEQALKYARKFEEILRALEKEGPSDSHNNKAQMLQELDRSIGRALVMQARATGNLGRVDEAIALATRSYERYASAESAREIGRWLARSGKELEAIEHYADAFTIEDPKNTPIERARDRAKMGELYRKVRNSEGGLGDIVLKAYDRTSALLAKREAMQRSQDPNSVAKEVVEFTLNGLRGDKLPLASLKGKVVVMDFWATWCGPCRVQHPLYEKVKQKFAKDPTVVFLSINTDEEQSPVKPFIEAQNWSDQVYFEGGLSDFLRVSSIPTTVILDKDGRVISRLNGFLPERFVEMLSERIKEALGGQPVAEQAAKTSPKP